MKWPKVSIESVSDKIDYGYNDSASQNENGYKFLRITDIQNNKVDWEKVPFCTTVPKDNHQYDLNPGDLVFARTGATTGKSFLISECPINSIFASYLIRIRPNNQLVDSMYLRFYFETPEYWRNISSDSAGATLPGVNSTKLKKLQIPLPPLDDQIRIVDVLTRAENLIAKRKESIKALDEFLKSTFLEMFGDPVRNEKGWEAMLLKQITKVGTGGTPSRKNELVYFNGTIAWAKTTEVNGNYIYNTSETITEFALKDSNCKVYPIHTILLAMYGQGKTRGNVGYLKIEAATNQACAAIIPTEKINQIFLFELLKNSYLNLRSLARGGNQENLNLDIVGNYPIVLPPLLLQNKFAAIVEKVEAMKVKYNESLVEMEKLYGGLSQRAFRGEL